MKTVILSLWGPNGVKNAALEETEHLFGRIVSFYVPVLLAEPSLWEKLPHRDEKTHAPVCDPETGEILMRKPKPDEVLTRAEALTFVTQPHLTTLHPFPEQARLPPSFAGQPSSGPSVLSRPIVYHG